MIASAFHILIGIIAQVIGIIQTKEADVWMAHRVCPIWSGITISCFTLASMVSLLTALVSIQLLRLGLVIHTTQGDTYVKETLDHLILVALGVTAFECINCVLGAIASCKLAKLAKIHLRKRQNGLFHVLVFEDKDIMVVTKDSKPSNISLNCLLDGNRTSPSTFSGPLGQEISNLNNEDLRFAAVQFKKIAGIVEKLDEKDFRDDQAY
ncbi:hypothetical protein Ciccas_012150 [Cichlidogyrus casuarinus]|uniref:Uncharacterized protein n=1 Tax=Cichlidogyrus casuarinus TaxID=1844966 RepID=A0ABD2PPP0_9PLAT